MRKPRKPNEAQKRLAYLEGIVAAIEGAEKASPYTGTPLVKHWLRGFDRGEELCGEIRADLYDDVREEVKRDLRDEAEIAEYIDAHLENYSRREVLPNGDSAKPE